MPGKSASHFETINVFTDKESHLRARLINKHIDGTREEEEKKIFKRSLALNHPCHYNVCCSGSRGENERFHVLG